jgi:hypothetical protein
MSIAAKPKRRRSPQEKKKLSYERDRVNVYGQNDKASRKRIPKFKAATKRALRRGARVFTESAARAGDAERADTALAHHRPGKGRDKVRDFPLGFVLDERPVMRIDGADRAPTRNVRESLRSALERRSSWEHAHEQQPQRVKRKQP